MKIKLFIDTNVYLTFYHYTSEDLEELKKLSVAIKDGSVDLQLTSQVISEFKRNREAKIFDALKKFEDQKLNSQFPQICKEYQEYNDLRSAIKNYEESKNIIMQSLQKDIEKEELGADKVISDLFAKATVYQIDERIFEKAKIRKELGNPPGKNGSLGDALNWEILLSEMKEGEDLYLISDDKDYFSPINENFLSKFLNDEWQLKKSSKVFFYRKLSDFFRAKFPQIKLASELEKELAISRLAGTTNFQGTHNAIRILSKYTDFTDQEINEIIEAAINNNQVFWIKDDPDIKDFFNNLLKNKEKVIEENRLESFVSIFRTTKEKQEKQEDDDVF